MQDSSSGTAYSLLDISVAFAFSSTEGRFFLDSFVACYRNFYHIDGFSMFY